MGRLLPLVVLALLAATPIQAQNLRTVTGRVRTVQDSVPLVGVTVQVVGTTMLASSDTAGSFVLRSVPRAQQRIAFARIGILPDTVVIGAAQDTLDVYLQTVALELDPLIATAAPLVARERFETEAQTSTITIDRNIVQTMPAFMEADVIRTIQLLPGTVAVNDYAGGYNTRGGEADQNLIQLDGMTIFNPSHLGGLFSTFYTDAVDDMDYLTGGFPAHYGGRLSSVLDVAVRPGLDRVSVSGQISLISSKLMLEGPIPGTRATWLVGGRRTYADKVIATLTDEVVPYHFWDGLAKVTHPLGSGGGTISLTGYLGRDVLDWEFVEAQPDRPGIDLEVNWGNKLLGLGINHSLFGKPVTFTANVSDFSTTVGLVPDIIRIDNKVRLLAANASIALSPGATHDVTVGGAVDDYQMLYDFRSDALTANFWQAKYDPRVWSVFVDDQWRVTDWLLLRPGVRMESVQGADFTSLAPRISAKAFLTDDFALTGSAGRYYQAIHSLRDHNVPWSFLDFWIGADSVTPVSRSDHVVAGFEKWFNRGLSLTLEGYYKTFRNVINVNYEDDLKVQGDEFVPVDGEAYGADLMLRKYTGRIRGWISYSFGKATRRDDSAGVSARLRQAPHIQRGAPNKGAAQQ